MRTNEAIRVGAPIALLLAAGLVACGATNDAPIRDAVAAGSASGFSISAQASVELSSVDVDTASATTVSIVHTINDGAIAEAQTALALTDDPDAVDFANLTITQATTSNSMLDALGI